MSDVFLMQALQHSVHDLLVWIGFGTMVGLVAKALLPGRDPGGAIGTMITGILGSFMGCGLLLLMRVTADVNPISALGFAAGIGGATILLLLYRLLANSFVREPVDHVLPNQTTRTYHRRRRRVA
ncbi:MAG: hypothetical protein KatS3mg114_0701 [Planctomycetaceae bacterium]|nr:MAG: hypothetical protein KatS3mg114_0701 [Planctomycetaceae bacterium]